jgi:putative tryptophan/tyrosine transport system substrate-binding protein
MKRREFITLLGGATAAWPLVARAQQPAVLPVVGFLCASATGPYAPLAAAFAQGLKESGFIEGVNVVVEYRWGESQSSRLPALAADLVRRKVAVIAATGGEAAVRITMAATTTIPIVFQAGGNPVEDGFVPSLARPIGNVTGVTLFNVELLPKRLELLHELVPAAKPLAALLNPQNPSNNTTRNLNAAAQTLGLDLQIVNASNEQEIDAAFASLVRMRAGGLLIGTGNLFTSHSEQLAALTLRHTIPAIYGFRQFPAAGGLISYGGNTAETYRLVGVYVGRILKGDKPSDLPVIQPSKFEMVINRKTASALGVVIPPSLLALADEVIE